MRPGLVFLLLFGILIGVYAGLVEMLGPVPTFVLQTVIVLVILAASLWVRGRMSRARQGEQQDHDRQEHG